MLSLFQEMHFDQIQPNHCLTTHLPISSSTPPLSQFRLLFNTPPSYSRLLFNTPTQSFPPPLQHPHSVLPASSSTPLLSHSHLLCFCRMVITILTYRILYKFYDVYTALFRLTGGHQVSLRAAWIKKSSDPQNPGEQKWHHHLFVCFQFPPLHIDASFAESSAQVTSILTICNRSTFVTFHHVSK